MHATWFVPQAVTSRRAALYLHGGGYIAGDLEVYAPLLAELATCLGHRVLFVDYALAPEQPFPRALEDAIAVYRWLAAEAAEGDGDWLAPSLIGDSCGAGLAIALAAHCRDQGMHPPSSIVGLSPTLDFTGTIAPTYDLDDVLFTPEGLQGLSDVFRGELGRDDPRISPVFAALHDLPPMLFQVGSGELVRAAAEEFALRARRAGGTVELSRWSEMPHVWHLCLDDLPDAHDALAEATRFLQRYSAALPISASATRRSLETRNATTSGTTA